MGDPDHNHVTRKMDVFDKSKPAICLYTLRKGLSFTKSKAEIVGSRANGQKKKKKLCLDSSFQAVQHTPSPTVDVDHELVNYSVAS